MHKQFKVPVKLLLIVTIAVSSLLMLTGLALAATRTAPNGADRFDIIDSNGSTAYFSIGESMTATATTLTKTVLSRSRYQQGLRTLQVPLTLLGLESSMLNAALLVPLTTRSTQATAKAHRIKISKRVGPRARTHMEWNGPSSTLAREASLKLHPIATRMTKNVPSGYMSVTTLAIAIRQTRIQKTGRILGPKLLTSGKMR